MTDVDTQALLAVHNCSLPHCDREAPVEGGRCDIHRTLRAVNDNGMCKVDGCVDRADKYTTGMYAHLCPKHIGERRIRASTEQKAKWAARQAAAKTGPVQPAAVEAPAVSGGAQDGASISLVALAQHVEDTRAAFRAAVTALREGVAALEAAA